MNPTSAMFNRGTLSRQSSNSDGSKFGWLDQNYQSRVNKLTEKLNGLHVSRLTQMNIEQDKNSKLDNLDKRVTDVEDKLLDWHEGTTKRVNSLREQVRLNNKDN